MNSVIKSFDLVKTTFRGLHKTKRKRKHKHKKKDNLTIRCVPRFNKGWSLKSNKIIHKQLTYKFPFPLIPEGDIVYLGGFPHRSVKVKKIKWEKKGKHIRYKVPKYRVEFIDSKKSRRWFKEYELESLPSKLDAKIVTDSKDSNADNYNEK